MNEIFKNHIVHLQKGYEKAFQRTGVQALLIHSGSLHRRYLDDSTYPFRVNPHFNHWLPITDNPDCFLLIRPGHRPFLYYYMPDDFWHKAPSDPEGFWVEEFDIKIVSQLDQVKDDLQRQFSNGLDRSKINWISEFPKTFDRWGLGPTSNETLFKELNLIRSTKSDYEIHCLEKANLLGAKAHGAALSAFRQGLSEYEIHRAYNFALDATEHDLPYENIIALNEHAAVLHYHGPARKKPAYGNRSFLIDAGAKFNGYCSDISRTYAFADGPFNDLVAALENEQKKLISELKVGQSYVESHEKSHLSIARLLKDFDFVRMDLEEMVSTGVTKTFYPHGLGHFLGIQVHDVGGYRVNGAEDELIKKQHPHLRATRQILPGHVFTIEPGLYFIPSLLEKLKETEQNSAVNWEKVGEMMPFGGIRIEDNIHMTEKGPRNLTALGFAALA